MLLLVCAAIIAAAVAAAVVTHLHKALGPRHLHETQLNLHARQQVYGVHFDWLLVLLLVAHISMLQSDLAAYACPYIAVRLSS